MLSQFTKYDSVTSDTQGTPYDFDSVMHYGSDDFTANGFNTIEPIPPYVKIGQRYFLSSIDISAIRLFYSCSAVGTTLPPPTTTPTTRKHAHNISQRNCFFQYDRCYFHVFHVLNH